MEKLTNLLHPFSRYGLAVALFQAHKTIEDLNLETASTILLETIENSLNRFRMKTGGNPQNDEFLEFDFINLKELIERPNLVTGGASEGRYLYPTVITGDKLAGNTFKESIKIVDELKKGKPLAGQVDLKRAFAPITAKVITPKNSAKEEGDTFGLKEPKGTRFEAACCAIATLTPLKPAAYAKDFAKSKKRDDKFYNVTIIPDLSLSDLREFLEVFSRLQASENPADLMKYKVSGEKKFKRPKIRNGNYPFAPKSSAFGAIGLLAAIGKWAQRAEEGRQKKAMRVLQAIAGTEVEQGKPIYLIGYDGISQVFFTHHIVNLSKSGRLSEIIEAFARDTRLYGDVIENTPKRMKKSSDKEDFESAYELFDLIANRFLQLFNQPAFQDFLAIRAEYPAIIEPLLGEYFMEARKINREIVESARALGQWLNRTAYLVADSETEETATERAKKVRQSKAKILVDFESAAMSAKTPQDMLHRISTRAGRLLQQDMPAEATRFMDETNIGEFVSPKDAVHLLIAYMRLRTAFEKSNKQSKEINTSENQTTTFDNSDIGADQD